MTLISQRRLLPLPAWRGEDRELAVITPIIWNNMADNSQETNKQTPKNQQMRKILKVIMKTQKQRSILLFKNQTDKNAKSHGGEIQYWKAYKSVQIWKHFDSIQEIQNVYQASSSPSRFVQGNAPTCARMFTPQHHRGRPSHHPTSTIHSWPVSFQFCLSLLPHYPYDFEVNPRQRIISSINISASLN